MNCNIHHFEGTKSSYIQESYWCLFSSAPILECVEYNSFCYQGPESLIAGFSRKLYVLQWFLLIKHLIETPIITSLLFHYHDWVGLIIGMGPLVWRALILFGYFVWMSNMTLWDWEFNYHYHHWSLMQMHHVTNLTESSVFKNRLEDKKVEEPAQLTCLIIVWL